MLGNPRKKHVSNKEALRNIQIKREFESGATVEISGTHDEKIGMAEFDTRRVKGHIKGKRNREK